jgi:hypothetical protein
MNMAKTIDIDAEVRALDAVTSQTHPARDAAHFRAIVAAAHEAHEAEARLVQAVTEAREAGDSWTVVGAALGVTKQAAQQWYSRRVTAA